LTKKQELKFEEALARLEEVVHRLEEGDLSLDEALNLHEEGVALSKICSKKLDEAQRRIEILTKDKEGQFITKPFSPEELLEDKDSEEDLN